MLAGNRMHRKTIYALVVVPCADAVYLLDSVFGAPGPLDAPPYGQTGNIPDNYTQFLTTGFLAGET